MAISQRPAISCIVQCRSNFKFCFAVRVVTESAQLFPRHSCLHRCTSSADTSSVPPQTLCFNTLFTLWLHGFLLNRSTIISAPVQSHLVCSSHRVCDSFSRATASACSRALRPKPARLLSVHPLGWQSHCPFLFEVCLSTSQTLVFARALSFAPLRERPSL